MTKIASIAARRRGFTLPEVLAALVLIGIVVPVSMRGLSMALSASSHARYVTEATALGEMKLNEMVCYGEWSSSASGDFGTDWPQYRWTCQTQLRDFGLTEIELEVTWTEAGRERSLKIATLVDESRMNMLP